MFYKNVSTSVKTFHGVTFNPGDIKKVDKYINDKWMILADKPLKGNETQQKLSSDKSKKESSKDKDQKPESVQEASADPISSTPKEESKESKEETKEGSKQDSKKS